MNLACLNRYEVTVRKWMGGEVLCTSVKLCDVRLCEVKFPACRWPSKHWTKLALLRLLQQLASGLIRAEWFDVKKYFFMIRSGQKCEFLRSLSVIAVVAALFCLALYCLRETGEISVRCVWAANPYCLLLNTLSLSLAWLEHVWTRAVIANPALYSNWKWLIPKLLCTFFFFLEDRLAAADMRRPWSHGNRKPQLPAAEVRSHLPPPLHCFYFVPRF